jgi:hypothetical protein
VSSTVVTFDAATFDRLIAFMTKCKEELDKAMLKPTSGLMLDGTLKTFLKPGAPEWPVVNAVLEAAGAFGTATHEQLKKLSKEWGDFIKALNDAKNALKKGDDLASMSASDFLERFPNLAPPGSGPGGGTTTVVI